MERKHTPGPWTASTDALNYGKQVFIEGDEGKVLICEMNHNVRRVMLAPSDIQADAQLIAAAPDLLEACEGALAALDADAPDVSDRERVDALDNLKDAIKKARGG